MKRWHGRREPAAERLTHPLFADQRVFGVTLSTRIKILSALVVIGVITNAISIFVLSNTISAGHRQRLSDEKALACLLVEGTPPGNTLGDEIRTKYHCAAYVAPSPFDRTSSSTPPSGMTRTSESSKPQQSPAPTSSSTLGAHQTPTRTITRTTTLRRSRTRSAPSTSTPIVPPVGSLLPSSLCSLTLLIAICELKAA